MSKTTVSEIVEGVALARPLAQALIWGGGSALSSSIADKKSDETPEEKRNGFEKLLLLGLLEPVQVLGRFI